MNGIGAAHPDIEETLGRHRAPHLLFQSQATLTPNSIAVSSDGDSIDYRTLDERANRLAHHLVQKGTGPGDIVGLALPNTPDLIIALLAVLKSGACYLPLDPSYPEPRLAFMLSDAAPSVVLTSEVAAGPFRQWVGDETMIQIDSPSTLLALATRPDSAPVNADRAVPWHPDDPCYLVYTSGSTGHPKGVMGRRGALANRLTWIGDACPFAAGDRVLGKTSLNFIDGSTELLGALVHGATVVLPAAGAARDANALTETIRRHSISRLTVVPSLLSAFLDTCDAADLKSCRTWIVSGEALPPALKNRFADCLPEAALYNFYGASEAAGDSLYALCDAGADVSIGGPISNTTVHVLDDRLQSVDEGENGELYIAGEGLALGYHRRFELTCGRFVADPFGPPGARMYRTGDVVCRQPDGRYRFVGRADHQVKIRGVRVEPGEVESVLGTHPQVGRSAVVGRVDAGGEMQLVAYVVAAGDDAPDINNLRSWLGGRVPPEFVPDAFVPLDALPLTPNGKLDRASLPEPSRTSRAAIGPRTADERLLCTLFAQHLSLDVVGIDDNFFELGGHSLLAARLLNRLRRMTGMELGVKTLFDNPTVASLAQLLRGSVTARPPLLPQDRPDRIPLSFSQQRLWFLNQINNDDRAYHLPFAVRLRGRVEPGALQSALSDLIERHECLRTVFSVEKGIPHQRVLSTEEQSVPIEVEDTSEDSLTDVMNRAAARPFDLSCDLPLRAVLFALGTDDQVLLLTLHHIAMDGASLSALWGDLSAAYEARLGGVSPDWPPLPVQYVDYTLWQAARLGDEGDPASDCCRQLEFWRATLKDLPDLIQLPSRRARPETASTRGALMPLHISDVLHAGLLRLATETGASTFMVLHAGIAALLTRFGAGTDITIGAPTEGRPDDLLDGLIGLFINMLVLRTDVSGNPSFRTLIERVRRADLDAFANQDLPFDRLVDELCPERTLSHHPLFQVVLALQVGQEDPITFAGLQCETVDVKVAASKFDLSLDLTEIRQPGQAPGGIQGSLEFSTDLFEPQFARTFVDCFVQLLEVVVDDPDTGLNALDIVRPRDRHRLMRLSLGAVTPVPDRAETMQACFARHVERQPEATALVLGDTRFSYAELDRRANALAGRLVNAGVGPDNCVLILMERSVNQVVATLATIKAGGTYVPLNMGDPAARHRIIVSETQAKVLLVDGSALADDLGAPVILDVGEPDDGHPAQTIVAQGLPDDLACILYTSGSTGQPKGIGLTHRNIVSFALDGDWDDSAQERVMLHSPFAFDASTYELWIPLLRGRQMVIAPPGLLDPNRLDSLIKSQGVTAICLTTRLFNLVAAENPACLAPVRYVLIGGEAASPAAVRNAMAHCPTTDFVNGYGPAEGTTFVTSHVAKQIGEHDDFVPIGLPRDNVRLRVLDNGLQPVGVGAPGELYIGGCSIGRGYLNRPDLTSERFVCDPHGPPGARMYRTGDLVEWRPDGQLAFVGRADHQAKINGFRIEPGEIETVLCAHCDVGQCAVLIREDRPGDKRVVAYIVSSPDAKVADEHLRSHVSARLPTYMVPSAFVVLDSLPFTTNGKLDRRALPAPVVPVDSGRTPRNEREARLCALFCDILGLEEVGIDDGFFSLGGDSIMSLQLVSRARQIGVGLTPGDVLRFKTVAQLAANASEVGIEAVPGDGPLLRLGQSEVSRLEADLDGLVDVLPLTPLQEGLLFHALYDAGEAGDVYTVQAVLDLEGRLDATALRHALQQLIDRHANLRVCFRHEGLSRPVQAVLERVELPWRQVDAIDAADGDEALRHLLAQDRAERFDMAQAPLLRAILVRRAVDRHSLVLTNHHILLDGWSLPVLMSELLALYRGEVLSPAAGFQSYLGWLAGQDREAARQAWRAALEGLEEPTRLAGGVAAPAADTAGQVEFTLSEAATAALEALARRLGVTPNTVVQGAWALLLGHMSGRNDVVFGVTVSGRPAELAGVETMVGLFINTVPARVRLRGGDTVAALLEQIQASQAQLLPHQHLGLADIQAEAGPGELFDTLLVFENYPQEQGEMAADGLRLAGLKVLDETHYPVSLMVVPGRRMAFRLDHRRGRVDDRQAEALAARLQHVLAEMVAAPERAVGAVGMMPPAERRELVERWNGTARAVPETSLPALIEAQVAASPEATALICGDAELSYATLDAAANRLAHHLIGLGTGAEDIVALVLPRGIEMVTAVLAVLKSGGAYLPIDPTYPAERIETMLADAEPSLVVSLRAQVDGLASAFGDRPTLLMDETAIQAALEDEPAEAPSDTHRREPIDADHPAYVIYTSGSTGKPKGVVVTHRGIGNLALSQNDRFGIGPTSRVLQFASFSFDAMVSELSTALIAGAAVVMLPRNGFQDVAELSRILIDRAVTHATLPPAVLALLEPDALPDRLTLISAGEACPPDVMARHSAHRDVINAYGPTETTVCATMSQRLRETGRTFVPPIGRPIWNFRVHVLDRFLQPVGIDRPGELYVGGPGLARCYRGRPGLTAERFVADPFGPSGSRMYRTGDRVRRAADGSLVFVGRTDRQLKIRGHRIEPAEVEKALAVHRAVAQSAAVAREDRPGDKRLVAYVTARSGRVVDAEGLRRVCEEQLPSHMVPSVIVPVDKLPLTPNGKLDLSALPVPGQRDERSRRSPRNDSEALLCRLFAEVLGLQSVGIDDNFFSLGGDSILSIRLVSKARQAGLELLPRAVFEHKTVAALAVHTGLAEIHDGSSEEEKPTSGSIALTPIMHWLCEQSGPMTAFNQALLLTLPESVDADRLGAALQSLLDQHDMLRLRIGDLDNWNPEIRPVGSVRAEACLRRCPIGRGDSGTLDSVLAAQTRAAEKRLAPDRGEMMQAVWFDLDDGRPGRLLLVLHHLVVDGVSWRILIDDLQSASEAIAADRPIRLPTVQTSFRDWARHLASDARTERRAAELGMWTAVLDGSRARLDLPPLDPTRDRAATAGRLRLTLDSDVTSILMTRLPDLYHCGLQDVLLCAFALAVANWRDDGPDEGSAVLLDLEGHGRETEGRMDLSRTVGWFTTLYPVCLELGPVDPRTLRADRRSLGQVLKRVKEQLRQIPDRGLGFGLLRYLNPEGAAVLGALESPQTSFNYLGRFPPVTGRAWSPAPEGAELAGGADPDMPLSHALSLDAQIVEGSEGPRLVADWTFATALLSERSAETLAQCWFDLLEVFARHAGQPLAGGHTPSDFALLRLGQSEVSRLEADLDGLVDVLPLTPLQEGLLFHALYDAGEAGDVYTVQAVLDLEGRLDATALRHALQQLIDRHANLRVCFRHEGLSRPVQAVLERVELPWRQVDAIDAADGDEALRHLLAQDRAERFDMAQAPLLRAILVRRAVDRHSLVLTNHHILLDGWSLPVLMSELLALYRGEVLSPAAGFQSYLGWLAGQDREAARQAWRAALEGLEEPTRLAGGVAAPAADTAGQVEFTLSEAATAALEALARRLGVTPNTVVQGAWALLLGHMSGRNDVVFGVTVSGRPAELAGVETMVGLFINTVPARVRLRGGDTVAALLEQIQASQAQLLPHQHLGLADIQAEAGLGELFDTLLVFENYPQEQGEMAADGLRLAGLKVLDETHYPVSLMVVPGRRMAFRLDHRRGRVDDRQAEALAARLQHVLAEMVAAPERAVGAVGMMPPAERRELVERWNGTARAVPETSLPALIEAQVAASPEATALICGDAELSYATLDAAANRLAHHLIGLGTGAEDIVALVLPRGIEMVTAVLAVLKSGGAYLPIDPTYPAERIETMLADAEPSLVVSLRAQVDGLASAFGDRPTLLMDETAIQAALEDEPAEAPSDTHRREPIDADHPAYVIYTSGSTGKPKGVVVTHRGIGNFLVAMRDDLPLTRRDRFVSVTTFGFDIAGLELFGPLISGGCVILPEGDIRDTETLRETIRSKQATVMQATPSLWRALLNDGDLPRIRVLAGGEALDADLAGSLGQVGETINLYGPTETTIWSAMAPVGANTGSAPAIGAPIRNTTLHVLDQYLRPVGIGQIGELYIGGMGLARGYHGQRVLTAERFVADPFGPPGARMYRSGDLVRRDTDGLLHFIGRNDQQLKIQGYRIELGEIESLLDSLCDVAQCAVVAQEERHGHHRLVAYVVPGGERAPDTDRMRREIERFLPHHMVPTAFVMLDRMPLTLNGKIDRNALPVPKRSLSGRQPESDTERTICGLFAEVLQVESVGVDDGFFELGGNSILAMRLVSLIRDRMGLDLSVKTLFEHHTVAELLAFASAEDSAALGPLLPLRPGSDPRSLFCIHPGYGLGWSYHGLAPHLGADFPLYGLQASGFLEDQRLPRSLEALAEDYVTRIRAVQPKGPYHLLGWSFGGLAAFEIAAQLREAGEQVGLLALLDSYPAAQVSGAADLTRAGAVAALFKMCGERPPAGCLEKLPAAELRVFFEQAQHPLAALSATEIERMLAISVNNARLADAYIPGRYRGDMLHVEALKNRPASSPDAASWNNHVEGRVIARYLDCDHHSVTEAGQLAEIGRMVRDILNNNHTTQQRQTG